MHKRFILSCTLLIVYLASPVTIGSSLYSGTTLLSRKRPIDEISVAAKTQAFDAYVLNLYAQAGLAKTNLDFAIFRKAVVGYYNIHRKPNHPVKPILTVIDFTKSSRQKRLWVVDLKTNKLLFNTWVAHGKGTGDEFARFFSNEPNSFKSSLGFYLTSQTYQGKHGLSLKLNGLDKNYNTNALARAVVIHGADYVSASFIKQYGRLGRSLGCPALPVKETQAIISKIKNNTCLYIHGAIKTYASPYLTEASAIDSFATQFMSMNAS